MDWTYFGLVSGVGVVFLLNVLGILALVLPGRLDAVGGPKVGLGGHVEALLILSFASTVYLSGFGNVPVYIDENGVVAFSLIGALLPALLSMRFLWKAGPLRGPLALVGIAATSWVSYVVSMPAEGTGIIARYPYFLLPSATAALAATLIAPRSIAAVPIAYACGSLGALIGGDLVRFGWVVETKKAIAGSFGGAEFFDLVFLAGLWGAAFAAIPLVGYWATLRRPAPEWEEVARVAKQGDHASALRIAVAIVEGRLSTWAERAGMADRPPAEQRRLSYAAPVLDQVAAALRMGPMLPIDHARGLLERLSSLDRRLRRPVLPKPAPSGRRTLAGLIDLVPAIVLAALAYALSPRQTPSPELGPGLEDAARIFFAVSTFVSVHILLPLVTEWATRGATLGKALVGLRVRRLDGQPPTAWDAIVRNIARLLDVPLFYLIAFASPAYAGRQRLGDYFAGTVVVADTKSRMPVMAAPTATPAIAIQPADAKSLEPRWPGVERSKETNRQRK